MNAQDFAHPRPLWSGGRATAYACLFGERLRIGKSRRQHAQQHTSSRTTCTRRHASEAVTVAQVLSKQARGATAHGRDTCEEKASSPSIVTHCRDDRQGQHVRARSDHAKWMCRAHTSWIRTMSRTRTPPQRHASVRELNTQSRPVAKSLKKSQSQGCSQR